MNLIDFEGYNIASERVAVKKHSAQLREQIAKEIEANDDSPFPCGCIHKAAKIARGK